MKLTPWFPGAVKPVRVGVYQVKPATGARHALYSHWTGKYWVVVDCSIKEAGDSRFFGVPSALQRRTWRGLAERPTK